MPHGRVLGVVALLGLLVVALPPVGASHGSPVNATAVWGTHDPGAENVTLTAYASGAAESASEGLEVWKNFTTVSPEGIGYNCIPEQDTRAAGIDRDNDDPGTETDVSMIGKFKYFTVYNNSADQTVITIVFYDEDDFGGETIYLNATDQLVAKFADCWHLPDQRGWYRNYGHVNGTNWSDSYGETDSFSHWYYVCDCESYDAAVATIGPPPEGHLAHSDQEVGRMEHPYYLTEPRPPGWNDTDAATPTPTRSPDSTVTPTVTPTATPPPTPTPTATAPPMTPTETPTATASTETPVTTEQPTEPPTTDGTTSSPGTASGTGPGFGVLAALLALLAVSLARRA